MLQVLLFATSLPALSKGREGCKPRQGRGKATIKKEQNVLQVLLFREIQDTGRRVNKLVLDKI
ncbi:hypothetical protein D0T57_05370 [Dysgonomonas sp. 511]|nr:hypothetical protein [Dysgonomonas sp. 511]